MNTAKSSKELYSFLNYNGRNIKQKLRSISFNEQDQWKIENGVLTHKTRGFFHVTGVESYHNNQEQHLMLYQPQSALTGLLLCKKQGVTYVLLQARTEPGNIDFIQYGPTVQSTAANYLKLHGGKSTNFIEAFLQYQPDTTLITHSIQHDLGKRYYQKSKTHHYCEVSDLLPCDEHMIWASIQSVFGILKTDNFVNPDLRSLLAVFDWDYFHSENKVENSPSLYFLKNDRISKIKPKHKLIPLTDLKKWTINDDEISAQSHRLPYVKMFHFIGESREKKEWQQPLICVEGEGLSQLFCRDYNNEIQYLLTIDHEVGISTNFAMYPTKNLYAEEVKEESYNVNGELITEFIQCDEGGRFYQNNIRYQVYQVDENHPINDNQVWVSRKEMKQILATSNIASIQLRCICSVVIEQLNPETFYAQLKESE